MFNFNGQSKRRNINLSTNNRASKKELLAQAQKEREKRALAKKEQNAIIIIQNVLRKVRDTRSVLDTCLKSKDETILVHLIPIFGRRLLSYISKDDLKYILTVSNNYSLSYKNSFYNIKLLEILGSFSDGDEELIIETFNDLNPRFPVSEMFVSQVTNMLLTSYSTSEVIFLSVSKFIRKWNILSSPNSLDLFCLHSDIRKTSDNLMSFYKHLAQYAIFPLHIVDNRHLLNNICIQYSNERGNRSLQLLIAQYLDLSTFNAADYNDLKDIHILFESNYISQLMAYMDLGANKFDALNTIVNYVSLAKCFKTENSILITILAKENFVRSIFNQLIDNSQNTFETKEPIFILFIHLIEVYLLITTDQELLNNRKTITIKELKLFSAKLRDYVFVTLWNPKPDTDSKQTIDISLHLLRQLYLRDTRLKFCATNKDLKFWNSNDKEFLQVNIFKCLEIFEKLYREYILTHSQTSDEHMIDKVAGISSDISINVFEIMKNDSSINLNARQFKKFEILIKTPFFISFEDRVDIFYTFIAFDKHRLSLDSDYNISNNFSIWDTGNEQGVPTVSISRENLLEDAYNAYNNVGEQLKSKISVNFVNEFGPEAGIDGGGISKELLTSVTEEGFNSDKYGLFRTNDNYELYPNPNVTLSKLNLILFLGKIVGKCLYDRVLIDVKFTEFFMKKILNYSNKLISSFDDLSSLDNVLYQNLVKLLNMDSNEVEALELTFEIADENNRQKVIELVPNGSTKKVTKSNILQYIFAIADLKLNRQLYLPCLYFMKGMNMIIAPHWMEIFNPVELQMLISGGDRDIDLEDLRENTIYGGFEQNDRTIQDFWQTLSDFEPSERVKFIKFVTSVPRGPLQGFGSLTPKFGIRNSGTDKDRLPTASTCVNLLKLPNYQDKALLKQKLLYAINSGARFDLS
ncbi:hypothetical protein TPHA_0C04620 [Tetrapisispora phaffii CBS 4417]|uniref:HECT-type E3 ubiquitin transferase n=1 Tax=Tetrapisispora phaffii (strain ATCC 24235 / CBS 4417 / NBRC 1672 / NRRL Y-8282 / UCD 70-5) TaxID=1071381 RepID=G8BQV0_TETPH|nr:hypothetical protein TPHA_0C04620 [Tetrapisispora phaffii CBS 4417]CCE62612.1 hypothetical protein TPHA_0C04620 [Tetrapisispora phaffii CBS 4417]